MAAVRVVPAFDEFEDRHPGFDLCLEPVTVEELALERREEALTHRVIVRVAHAAHRRTHAHLTAALPEGDRRVLPWQPWSE